MQKNLTRGLARGAADPRAKTWPGAAELTLLRTVGMIWSTSDFSHPVVAPAMLLMGQYLSQGRVRNTADLGSGLFLCSLVAQVCLLLRKRSIQVRAQVVKSMFGLTCSLKQSPSE